MGKPDHECYDGHLEGCESAEPAWDLGDLLARRPCSGCCPDCHPPPLKDAEYSATISARRILGLPEDP